MKLLSLPNLLSLSRIPFAGVFLLVTSTTGRIVIVVTVAITDLADGYFARRSPTHDRRAGALIDPITDKLFVLVAFISFFINGDITARMLLVILARDVFTTFAFGLMKALNWKIEFRSRMSGKVVTVLQLAVLLALILWHAAVRPLVAVVAVTSLLACVDYTLAAMRQRRLAESGVTP